MPPKKTVETKMKVTSAEELARLIDTSIKMGQEPEYDDTDIIDERKRLRKELIHRGAEDYYRFLMEEVEEGIRKMREKLRKEITLPGIPRYLKGRLTDPSDETLVVPKHALHYGNQGKGGGRNATPEQNQKKWMTRSWMPEIGGKNEHPFPRAQLDVFEKYGGYYLLETTCPEENNYKRFILTCVKPEDYGKRKLWHGFNILPSPEEEEYLPVEAIKERNTSKSFGKLSLTEDEIDASSSEDEDSSSDEESEEEKVVKKAPPKKAPAPAPSKNIFGKGKGPAPTKKTVSFEDENDDEDENLSSSDEEEEVKKPPPRRAAVKKVVAPPPAKTTRGRRAA